LNAPFALEKLSTSGKVVHAFISPDGKNVIYTNGTRSDKESVWLRELATGNNLEIIPPSDDIYAGLALSPDGNTLYFVRRSRLSAGQSAIYRVSIFGGVAGKIISKAEGWISLSPDGKQLSFVRCSNRADENCSLWIADATDGKNERKLVSRSSPLRIGDNAFSPDGKSIAFAVGQSKNAANEFGLMEVSVENGAERELTVEKFFNIKSLAWLPDKSGLLITASKIPNIHSRLWHVSDDGKTAPLTKDSETYAALSLDKRAEFLVSTQVNPDFRLRLINGENAPKILTNAMTVSFAPDGKILFSSALSGNDEIWLQNADGSGQKQLTNNAADDRQPIVSPDGNSIFFASNRTGAVHVWRMNADGGNQTQVTQKEGGFPFAVSPDGRWVYYHHGLNRTLWRVSLAGEEQPVFNQEKYSFAVSPDGTQAAFADEKILTVISFANGQTVKTFKLNDQISRLLLITWTADGKSLAYTTSDNEFHNQTLWIQQLTGEPPQKIAALGDEEITSLAAAPDGKTIAATQGDWRHDAVLLKGLK
jgi:Tol biopolymer transport system component